MCWWSCKALQICVYLIRVICLNSTWNRPLFSFFFCLNSIKLFCSYLLFCPKKTQIFTFESNSLQLLINLNLNFVFFFFSMNFVYVSLFKSSLLFIMKWMDFHLVYFLFSVCRFFEYCVFVHEFLVRCWCRRSH